MVIIEDEDLLDFLEENGERVGQVHNLAMSSSLQNMDQIAETMTFDSLITEDSC